MPVKTPLRKYHIIFLSVYHMFRYISHSSQCSTTGVTKVMVCVILSVKEPLLLIGKSSPCGCSGFPLAICVVLYHMSVAIQP